MGGKGNKKMDNLGRIHAKFNHNLDSLFLFVNNVSPVVSKHDEITKEKMDACLKECLNITGLSEKELREKKKKRIELQLSKEQADHFVKKLQEITKLPTPQAGLLYQSAFVLLISYLDFLFSDLIHYYYANYSDALSGKDLSIALRDLKLCEDLADAMQHIINKEIDNVLYGNLSHQKKYFQDVLKIDLSDKYIGWKKINEAIERRNIIAHNDSKINKRYLKNIDSSLAMDKRDLKEGKTIRVNKGYFLGIYDELLVAGNILFQNCWRKWNKKDGEGVDNILNSDIYKALEEERWVVAERIGLFSKDCKISNETLRLFLDVNYCQSLKWQDKKGELKNELSKFDMETLRPIYQMGIYALKSDRDNFYKILPQAIKVDKIDKESLMTWPLFREFRREEEFGIKIEEVFSSK